MAQIAFLGLGNMGGPMAKNLIAAGHTLTVFDLVAEACAALAAEGALVATSALDAVSDADVIISMLPAGKHVASTFLGESGLLAQVPTDTLILDASTIDATTAREVGEAAAKLGIDFMDTPVSGGVAAATAGTLAFMCGGSQSAFERAREILAGMGSGEKIFHAGPAGAGQVAKAANNMLLAIHMIGTCEALAMGEAHGLDPAVLSNIMKASSGNNWSLQVYNPWPDVMEDKRSLAAAMKSTPMKFPNTDEKVGSLLYGGVGAKPSAYAVERNKRVFSNMSKHNLVFPTLGVHRLHFNGWSVLCRSLQDCFEAATNSGKDGMLMVTDCTGRRWTTEYFQGYNSYGKTHADQLDAKEQSKFTTVLPGDRIDLLCSAIGGFSEMLSFCQEFAGSLQFLSAHILRQDSPQARFRWHRDTEQGTNYVLTIVFLLSQTKSTMQVAGFEEVHYLGPGSGVAFPSDSEHRSGHADPGTLKIAIFFGTPAGPGGRVEKVRSLDTDWLVSEDWESCMCTNLYHLPGVTALPFDGIWIQCDGCNRWCHRVCTGLTKKEARTVSYTCPTCIEPTCWCNKLIHVTGFGEFDGHWVGCDNCDMFCHRICTGIAVEDMETASYVCPRCESTISSVVTELVDDIVNILTRFG